MKKRFIVLLSVIIIFTSSLVAYAQDTKEKMIQDFLLLFLDQSMHQAVFKYYGKPKMFDLYDAKIVDIKRLKEKGQFSFEVKVQVETYVGPHNPPYGLETITMVNDWTDIFVTKFEHQDLTPRRKSK